MYTYAQRTKRKSYNTYLVVCPECKEYRHVFITKCIYHYLKGVVKLLAFGCWLTSGVTFTGWEIKIESLNSCDYLGRC